MKVFDVYRDAGRSGPATCRWRCGCPTAAPDRTLTDEEVAARRARIVTALEDSSTGGSVPPDRTSVSVFGAAGYTGALAARLLHRHPYFELRAVTARSDVGARLDELYPYHRVPLVLEELDLDRHAESTPRSWPTRTARPRRSWPSCARAACASST